MSTLPTLVHLDAPREIPLAAPFRIRGWIASASPIHGVSAGANALTPEPRADVRAAKPEYPHVSGFSGVVDQTALHGEVVRLTCELGDGAPFVWEQRLAAVPLPPNKARRLERIRPYLQSERAFTENAFHFNFLTPEQRAAFAIDTSAAISSHDYAPAVVELIERHRDGLVLDAGAGLRRDDRPNVVTVEIFPFPSTDVLAVNEALPFRDNTFDATISCAVLEHVKDPFAAARELVRVTKPGGTIYADVPFLQPYHGYPSHYYNMTSQGLANLFAESCRIERTAVPVYGRPIWSLTWFLNSYLEGLPPESRERFRNLRVADLLARPETYDTEDFVRALPEAKNFELASVTSVWAVKK